MIGLRVNMKTQNINKSGYLYTVQQKVGCFWNPNEGKLMLMTVTTYIIKLLLM